MAQNRHVAFVKVFLGILFGILVLIAGFYLGLRFGPLPVAVADSAFPFERQIVRVPLRARVDRDVRTAPFAASQDVFEAGARIYRGQCSICHGTPGHDSPFARQMYPAPPQLWKRHGAHGTVGVSGDGSGFAYWFVANGVRLTGMPSFAHTLSDTEMWQVSLLLNDANKDLPATVTQVLNAQ